MRFAILLLSASALILLTGCSGSGGHPASTPSATAVPSSPATSASATPTPSPTATTPLLTGAAVKPGEVPPTEDPRFITDDSGGAIGFANYFYQALDWSIATTNPNLLRAISAPTCTTCQGYIHGIDALAASGGHSEGGRLIATAFAPTDGTVAKSDFVIQVTITQQQELIVDASGASSSAPAPINPATNYLYVSWNNGDFEAIEIGRNG
jgi:hypothetical protein